jgi:hypothetical protein
VICRDGGSGEVGHSNWCNMLGRGTTSWNDELNDFYFTGAQKYVCEREVSPLCDVGWAFFNDDDGSEGANSCVRLTDTTYEQYRAALFGCPRNSHMLSVKSSSRTLGLVRFAASLGTQPHGEWAGAFLETDPSTGLRHWRWIDGTPNDNIECGSTYCGMWTLSASRLG